MIGFGQLIAKARYPAGFFYCPQISPSSITLTSDARWAFSRPTPQLDGLFHAYGSVGFFMPTPKVLRVPTEEGGLK